jgi:hypothetical protein
LQSLAECHGNHDCNTTEVANPKELSYVTLGEETPMNLDWLKTSSLPNREATLDREDVVNMRENNHPSDVGEGAEKYDR